MLVHPQIDPVALKLGPVAIHWYGLTYLVAFGLFLWLASLRVKQPQFASKGWTRRDVEDLLFYGVLGVVIGGRLGYVLFYKAGYYASHFTEIFAVWKGGMSFHGGLIGVITAMAVFALTRKRPVLEVWDLIAPCVPTGLASGRIGNFINGELVGRVAPESLPWAMRFPNFDTAPRHRGQVSGAFLVGYGICRFVAEYFRQPDDFLGLLSLGLSMGQWLCVPMILAGAAMWAWASRPQAQGAVA